jgi:nitrogenase-stabilizing/protective protein
MTATPAQDYDFESATEDCESAEDFLDHFEVPYDRSVVHVYRLHILQRFHDYAGAPAARERRGYADMRQWLLRAYEDFVHSDAQTEKVFRVFKRASGIATVPLTSIGRGSTT